MTTALLMVRHFFVGFCSSLVIRFYLVEAQQTGFYFLSSIEFRNGILMQSVYTNGYSPMSQLKLETIRLMGAPSSVDSILVNGVAHTSFEILESNEILVNNLNIPVNSPYTITFKYSESSGNSGANSLFGYNFILFCVSTLYGLSRFLL